ncbi:MAG: choice-of-anchor D domain-containing protein [Bacteroidota bacterium]
MGKNILQLAACILLFSGLTVRQAMGQVNVPSSSGTISSEESGDEIMDREMFFHLRRAGGPGKTIPEGAYEAASQQARRTRKDRDVLFSPTGLTNWKSVNPTGLFYARTGNNYISGRTNSIAFHPTDANTFYIAAAGGGVWKTTDGGSHFNAVTDNLSALTAGSIAVDPNNANVVYVATGEMNYSLDSYYGDGIFKSTDGGSTWNKIATTSIGKYFSTILVDPQNSNNVYAAGSNGVYKSTNAGAGWTYTNSNTYADALVMNPTNTQILYVTTGYYNSNIIRKTTDGGATWTTLTNGLPPAVNAARTSLAISPSNANVVYASIAYSGNYGLLGLYRSTDAGVSWTLQNSSTNYLGGQGWYDNVVTVNPANSDSVIVGGLDIYSSADGGVTLDQITYWSSSVSINFSHADIHFLGYHGSVLYCGSDGGVYKSMNDGSSWSDLNRTISTLQFQSADYDPTNLQRFYGGTQDNNKEYTTNGGTDWRQDETGDGGYTVVDPVNTNFVYGQYVGGTLHRSNNHGIAYTEISPSASTGGLFYNPYEMAPGDHNTIVFGRADVWKTTSAQTATQTTGWTQIATTGTINGNVSAIAISSTNTNMIYVGTDNGRILATPSNGAYWQSFLLSVYVSDLVVDPANDAVCYATLTGFNASKHVYKTTNSGSSWFSITGNLPNIPVNSIVLLTNGTRTLFVGTDLGVYKSSDEGATWESFNNGLPAVEVFDLKYKSSNYLLLAATHGRGCFTFDLSPLSVQRTLAISSSNPNSGITLTPSKNDINGQGSALTPFARTYYDSTSVSVTVPSPQGGNYFSKWIIDGANLSINQPVTIQMDTNHTLVANFASVPTESLIVASWNPASGVNIIVDSVDNLNQTNGATPFKRYYYKSGVVSVSAPPTAGGQNFMKWQKNGSDYSTNPAISISMDTNLTITVLYGQPPTFHVAADTLIFGETYVNRSSQNSVVVSNHGVLALNIVSVSSDNPSAFSVDPTGPLSIPPGGNQLFNIHFNPLSEGLKTGNIIFSDNSLSSPDSIKASGTAKPSVQLYITRNNLWNLVSVPILFVNSDKDSVFPSSASSAFAYEGSYISHDTLNTGSGYWLKYSLTHVDTMFGTPISNDTISVSASWNLVGSISYPIPGSLISSIPPGIVTSKYFGYNRGYKISDTLYPGKGYWVKADTAGRLILVSPSLIAKEHARGTISNVVDSFCSLVFQDAAGNSQTLYFNKQLSEKYALDQYDLPPVPPHGVFDVRYSTDRAAAIFEEGGSNEYPVKISSAVYPLRISWDVKSELLDSRLVIAGAEIDLLGKGSFDIKYDPNDIVLKLGSVQLLPKVFTLQQNYPNPFNPTTTIRYGLPVKSRVTLKIYNLLGQEVGYFEDGIQDAGYKSQEWNASNVASGLYFYRLDATSVSDPSKHFSQTRKMILIK